MGRLIKAIGASLLTLEQRSSNCLDINVICQHELSEKKFLRFFYTRVKSNKTGRYEDEFPYISPCGPELNFIRCDDLTPVVFTQLTDNNLVWGNVDELTVEFDPRKLYMNPEGRIYHPYIKDPYVGLVASKIGISISNNFIFGSDGKPVAFRWKEQEHKLTNECEELLLKIRKRK